MTNFSQNASVVMNANWNIVNNISREVNNLQTMSSTDIILIILVHGKTGAISQNVEK